MEPRRGPLTAGEKVQFTDRKGKKITVFKYRPKKGSASKKGHRQPYTAVQIEKISV